MCFSRPVIIEVPHFAALRGKEREIVILRSDNGETWREHVLDASEDIVQDVLNDSFEAEGKEFLTSFHHSDSNSLLVYLRKFFFLFKKDYYNDSFEK